MHVLIRWGDPVTARRPAFDPANQTGRAGNAVCYNNDYLGLHPLPLGKQSGRSFLLVPTTNTSSAAHVRRVEKREEEVEAQPRSRLAAVGGSGIECAVRRTNACTALHTRQVSVIHRH